MKLSEKTLKAIGYVTIIISIFFQLAIISQKEKNNTFVELLPIAILLLPLGIFFFIVAKKKKKKEENEN